MLSLTTIVGKVVGPIYGCLVVLTSDSGCLLRTIGTESGGSNFVLLIYVNLASYQKIFIVADDSTWSMHSQWSLDHLRSAFRIFGYRLVQFSCLSRNFLCSLYMIVWRIKQWVVINAAIDTYGHSGSFRIHPI